MNRPTPHIGIPPVRRAVDPMRRLPAELSTLVIRNALPSNSDYAAHLLVLTTISRLWEQFLFSTPALWSILYVDERLPDLLAVLSTFIHFSAKTPLRLVIVQLSEAHWTLVGALLLPICKQITSLTIKDVGIYDGTNSTGFFPSLSRVLDQLDRLPELKELDFEAILPVDLPRLELLGISASVRYIGGLHIPLPESLLSPATSRMTSRGFFRISKYSSVRASNKVVRVGKGALVNLICAKDASPVAILMSGTLQDFDETTKYFNKCDSLEQFIGLTATITTRLTITILEAEYSDLVDCLRVLSCLRRLELRILSSPEPHRIISPSDVVISGLTTLFVEVLEITVPDTERIIRIDDDPFRDLLRGLLLLYPNIEELEYRAPIFNVFSANYIEKLRHIRSLFMELRGGGEPVVVTSRFLQELTLNGELGVRRIYASDILGLALEHDNSAWEVATDNLPRLRKLKIGKPGHFFRSSHLNHPEYYPNLVELDWVPQLPREMVACLSFSQLSRIRLRATYVTHPTGTALCTALMYNPEYCRSLQQLEFDTCVEWDILFFMLKRRNLETQGVKRIHTVAFPYVPYTFRDSLILLLEGERVQLPSLGCLSLEETREILFDSKIPGCFSCLKNMWPGCKETVQPPLHKHNITSADTLYPAASELPATVPTEISDWMRHQVGFVDLWKANYIDFMNNYSRVDACERFHKSPTQWR